MNANGLRVAGAAARRRFWYKDNSERWVYLTVAQMTRVGPAIYGWGWTYKWFGWGGFVSPEAARAHAERTIEQPTPKCLERV